MIKNRTFIIGIIIGACLAGAARMLFMPFTARDPSFLFGFLGGLLFVLLSFIPVLIWKKHSLTNKTNGQALSSNGSEGGSTKSITFRRIIISGIVIMTSLLLSLLLFRYSEYVRSQTTYKRLQLAQEAERIEAIRQNGQMNLLSQVLQKIDNELQHHPQRVLSDETIAGVAALSYGFMPPGDSLSVKKLSPLRGQLLLMLSKMKMDSVSFHKIILQTSFAAALLRDADLTGIDLNGADLKGADLKGTNLTGANLHGSNLRKINLWGANLSRANLSEADMTQADLRWSDLNGSKMIKVNLTEAELSSAQLRKADFHEAILKYAAFDGAFLTEANLANTDMFRANFTRAQMGETNMSGANMTYANLDEADIAGVNLVDAELAGAGVTDHTWLNRLMEWHVEGASEIQDRYKIIEEEFNGQTHYRLEKNKGSK